MDNLKKILMDKDIGKCLDFGTRKGEFLFRLKENVSSYKELIGIDNNKKAIKGMDKFNSERVKFIYMNGYDTDFPNGHYDSVSISNTLHHLNYRDRMLKEMYRVLKKDGYFFINEMFYDSNDGPKKTHGLMHILEAEIDTELGFIHNKTFTKNEIISIAESLNLKRLVYKEYNENEEYNKKLYKKYKNFKNKLLKVKDSPNYSYFKYKADEIDENFKLYGIERCKQLLIVGKK